MSNAWSELREQIEYFSQPFPEAAIAFADAHREEVTPFLVAAVARLADHPEEDANPDYVLHLYAMHLLAAWRETTAYAPLVRLGHHPDEVVEQLLGDTVTESYGRCLASVCDGDLAPLKGLVEDPAAAHWARHAALDAIMVRVFEGEASRDDLIAYLMPLGEAEAARLRQPGAETKTFELLDSVIAVATDIGASEVAGAIRGWFATNCPIRRWPICPGPSTYLPPLRGLPRRTPRSRQGLCAKREDGKSAGGPGLPTNRRSQNRLGPVVAPVRQGPKIGRNDPCPCGSGKKYKKCHGA
jgi:hypothetical protein